MLSLESEKTYRFAYEELMLRVFAFFDAYEAYNGRLANYLNEYMNSKRNIDTQELREKQKLINRTVDLLYSA